ncbi:MAG: hypothetical protein CMJ64_00615 [Planctomycetaceae bacterium]|nr:hypothetical protein [Planctomycetaceae bacterium]
MFGKPEWFKEKQIGWGLTPICWQGWLYAATWLAVISIPFIALVLNSLVIESFIWMTASLVAITLDTGAVLKAMKRTETEEDVLYIDEGETVSEEFATRNYDFRLRR